MWELEFLNSGLGLRVSALGFRVYVGTIGGAARPGAFADVRMDVDARFVQACYAFSSFQGFPDSP